MTNKQWHGSALWGKVNHFSANQWHFPPNMRLSASAYICLRQKHCCASAMQTCLLCSWLLRYSATPEIRFTPRQCKLVCSALGFCVHLPAAETLLRLGNCKLVCSALGFCDIRLRRKYGSRLGNASPTACITCSARCIRESKASRLLRTKHANANEFALLSASAYICQIFNSHWNEIRENSLLQGFGGKGRKDIHCARRDRDTHFHACRYRRVRKRRLSPGSQR